MYRVCECGTESRKGQSMSAGGSTEIAVRGTINSFFFSICSMMSQREIVANVRTRLNVLINFLPPPCPPYLDRLLDVENKMPINIFADAFRIL